MLYPVSQTKNIYNIRLVDKNYVQFVFNIHFKLLCLRLKKKNQIWITGYSFLFY